MNRIILKCVYSNSHEKVGLMATTIDLQLYRLYILRNNNYNQFLSYKELDYEYHLLRLVLTDA